ncbi:hypothetical protein BDY21DRAFT_53273 [Lineolata rhizophorae]|uniref:Transcription factor Iwr1 domain-containing protein n=1 Tax=Lineolata rhizophorae TaxID=578093 RepID=A0A6A6NXU9_9PEZI|nr:hypothetical protein BDY21DRAFT_53273 [Lineolata rhizophorae]
MSAPPSTVRVKRKRTEEPVDSLYVESFGTGTKRRATNNANFIFRRIRDDAATQVNPGQQVPSFLPEQPQRSTQSSPATASVEPIKPRFDANGVPILRTTCPGDEDADDRLWHAARASNRARQSRNRDVERPATDRFGASRLGSGSVSPKKSPLQHPTAGKILHRIASKSFLPTPRRFHLSRSATPVPSGPSSGGVQKRKGGKAGLSAHIATFVEREVQGLQNESPTPEKRSRFEQETRSTDDEPMTWVGRKKPRASEAEKQWRAQTWGKKHRQEKDEAMEIIDKSESAEKRAKGESGGNTGGKERANGKAMDIFQAMVDEVEAEENGTEQGSSSTRQTSSQPQRSSPFRTKPKPTLRYKDRHPDIAAAKLTSDQMELDISADPVSPSDDEYVYDTYVRYPHDMGFSGGTPEATLAKDGTIGVLVIGPDDEEDWKLYGEEQLWEDEEEVEDYNSDEDDENDENYYAADYPEEELDFDDEMGYGAYNYRHGGSDDEEYDATCSDGDDLAYPWGKGGY